MISILTDFHFQILEAISSLPVPLVKAWFSTSLRTYEYDHSFPRSHHDLAYEPFRGARSFDYKIEANLAIRRLHFNQKLFGFHHGSPDETWKLKIHPVINLVEI